MAAPGLRPRLTYAEYLALELEAEVKHEFVDGEMFAMGDMASAMAGGSRGHGLVQTSMIGLLVAQLAGKPCRPYGSDSRVFFPKYGDAAYPDAHVICGKAGVSAEDTDASTNPTLVVEVLSPSTERWDRGGKFERYDSLPSVKEYLLVEVERQRMELFRRNEDGTFTRHVFLAGQEVVLTSIGVSFPIGEAYALLDAENAAAAAENDPG